MISSQRYTEKWVLQHAVGAGAGDLAFITGVWSQSPIWPGIQQHFTVLKSCGPQTSIPQNHLGDVFKRTLLKQTSRVMKIFISNKYSDDAPTASRDLTFPPIIVFSVWETQLTDGNIYPLLENSAWEPSYTDSPPPQPGPPAFLGPQGREHVITQRAWVKWLCFM